MRLKAKPMKVCSESLPRTVKIYTQRDQQENVAPSYQSKQVIVFQRRAQMAIPMIKIVTFTTW